MQRSSSWPYGERGLHACSSILICPVKCSLIRSPCRCRSPSLFSRCLYLPVVSNMAQYRPKSVKDVSADDFIKAYSAHLKANDKVGVLWKQCYNWQGCARGVALIGGLPQHTLLWSIGRQSSHCHLDDSGTKQLVFQPAACGSGFIMTRLQALWAQHKHHACSAAGVERASASLWKAAVELSARDTTCRDQPQHPEWQRSLWRSLVTVLTVGVCILAPSARPLWTNGSGEAQT